VFDPTVAAVAIERALVAVALSLAAVALSLDRALVAVALSLGSILVSSNENFERLGSASDDGVEVGFGIDFGVVEDLEMTFVTLTIVLSPLNSDRVF